MPYREEYTEAEWEEIWWNRVWEDMRLEEEERERAFEGGKYEKSAIKIM